MADRFEEQRLKMVQEQLAARGIEDERLLAAMRKIPRHRFVEKPLRKLAYADCPLPIGQDQTISQPYIVAKMIAWLELDSQDKLLEIGTGSGYQTAILARLVQEVISLERLPALAQQARKTLENIGIDNVTIHESDGSLGWPKAAPYDAILVSAAGPRVPQALLEQLSEGARLVIPVGPAGRQRLDRWQRKGPDFVHEQGPAVAFVPLIGQEAWPD